MKTILKKYTKKYLIKEEQESGQGEMIQFSFKTIFHPIMKRNKAIWLMSLIKEVMTTHYTMRIIRRQMITAKTIIMSRN